MIFNLNTAECNWMYRLEQLLPLNSVVLKEESGYRGFYHHLLQPYEHYVPL